MSTAQLLAALSRLFPNVAKAVLAQLLRWQKDAGRASLTALTEAVRRGDASLAADLLLAVAEASPLTVSTARLQEQLPEAAAAYAGTAPPRTALVTTTTERGLVRAVAETVIDAQRVALDLTMPAVTFPGPRERAQGTVAQVSREMQRTARAVAYGEGALSYLRTDARAGVRAAIEAGLAEGRNPVDTARGLREIVGLGKTQALWVANLRSELEAGRFSDALRRKLVNGNLARTVEARVRSGKPLTKTEIDKLVRGYADKMRAFHAETVARTMTLDLLRHGQIAGLRDAVRRGEYEGLALLKTWQATLDERVRTSHEELHLEEIPLDAQWSDYEGTTLVLRDVPGGWQCRCSMSFRAVPRETLPVALRDDLLSQEEL